MNKLIVAAIATAVSGFVSVPAQAAPASVIVANTAATPVPTTVQNVVGVDVVAVPPTRARQWMTGCTINVGTASCNAGGSVKAPAGMVMRVVGVTGGMSAACSNGNQGLVLLTGTFKEPGGVAVSRRLYVPTTMVQKANGTSTVVQMTGEAFLTSIDQVSFGLSYNAVACGYASAGEVTVHYQLEPQI